VGLFGLSGYTAAHWLSTSGSNIDAEVAPVLDIQGRNAAMTAFASELNMPGDICTQRGMANSSTKVGCE
jgi:hypothetical protein